MKISITGGTGFVGTRLLTSLVGSGEEVFALIRVKKTEIPGVAYTVGDVSDRETLGKFLSGTDILVNLIGRFYPPYEDLVDTNVRIPSILYDEAGKKGVKRIVHISAAAVYGHVMDSDLPTEKTVVKPSTMYSWSKLFGEQILEYLSSLHGFTYVILRPTNIYGTGSRMGAIHSMLESYRANLSMSVTGDGMQSRDFLHVDDFVRAIGLALRNEHPSTHYNVASGEMWNMNDLANRIQELGGKKSEIIKTNVAPEHVRTLRADASLLRKDLQWDPQCNLDTYIKEVLAV